MVFTADSRICAERKEYHELRQENARANHSLISTLAIATIAMIGLTLAMHFGAAVGPAGLIACSVVTGGVGLGLIAASALRCIGFPKRTLVHLCAMSNATTALSITGSKRIVDLGTMSPNDYSLPGW